MRRERYPNGVIESLHGFAMIGPLIAAAVVVLAFRSGLDDALKGLVTLGAVSGALLAWVTFKAAALTLTYLWRIQHELGEQRRDSAGDEPNRPIGTRP